MHSRPSSVNNLIRFSLKKIHILIGKAFGRHDVRFSYLYINKKLKYDET